MSDLHELLFRRLHRWILYGGATPVACYWTNSVRTDLPGTGAAVANSVFVSGSTVYAAGYYNTAAPVACYWTNGVKTDLPVPGGATQAQALSIFVSGGTVYTAGFYSVAGTSTACYWTDTTRQDLLGLGGAMPIPSSCQVARSTLRECMTRARSRPSPCYWTGISPAQNLPGANNANANSLFVSGGTIYTAGQYDVGPGPSVACFWTGTTSRTSPPVRTERMPLLFVSGGTIYTAGQYNAATASIACYWTDTTKQDLPGAGANASSIYVSGGTVYTAGYYTSSGTTVACYWTGTTKTDLPGAGAQANSIFVQ